MREIEDFLHCPVTSVRTLDIYTIDAEISHPDLEKAASEPFCDPVIQLYTINSPAAEDFDFLIEVGFRPGVTDNIGRTAREAIEYITGSRFKPGEAVYTSVQYLVKGPITSVDAEKIGPNCCATPSFSAIKCLIMLLFGSKAGLNHMCRK
jgi:phosphoribosylformylglycinamidine synthase